VSPAVSDSAVSELEHAAAMRATSMSIRTSLLPVGFVDLMNFSFGEPVDQALTDSRASVLEGRSIPRK